MLANFWVHNGFVRVGDEKMSKSLGNFMTIRDVLQTTSAAALRLFLLSSQYRRDMEVGPLLLERASDLLYGLLTVVIDGEEVLARGKACTSSWWQLHL